MGVDHKQEGMNPYEITPKKKSLKIYIYFYKPWIKY
jgi:hypothetical protein